MTVRPFVLAAGFGNRLRPLTDVLPKPVIPLMGQPMVGYALARLARSGFHHVVLNGHHLAERLRDEVTRFRDRELPSLDLEFSFERPEILGTGGGLVATRPMLGAGTCAFVNGDILCDFDLGELLRRHRLSGAAATLLLVEHPEVERFGAITADAEGRVLDLANLARRTRGAAGGDPGPVVRRGVFSGVHLVEPLVFDTLPTEGFACIVRQGYVPMMKAGLDVRAEFHDGTWNDLGTIDRYLQTHVDLMDEGFPGGAAAGLLAGPSGIAFGLDAHGVTYGDPGSVDIAPTAKLAHPVALGAGCTVGPGAQIGPHTVLGRDVMVSKQTTLSEIVAWDGAVVDADVYRAVCFTDGGESRIATVP